MADQSQIAVKHNESAHRFEASVDGGTAVASYVRRGGDIVFTHTEVPEASRGKGVADELASVALAWARGQGGTIIPECPFIATYMRRHGGA